MNGPDGCVWSILGPVIGTALGLGILLVMDAAWQFLPFLVLGGLVLGLIYWVAGLSSEMAIIAVALVAIGVWITLLLACGPVVAIELLLIGGAIGFRFLAKPWVSLATPFTILAVSIAPHFLFTMTFDVMPHAEAGSLPTLFRGYEEGAIWLNQFIKPYLSAGWLWSILFALVACSVAIATEDAAPVRWLGRYRRWTGRLSLAILGVTSFTVFSTVPSQKWTPDTSARLVAQLRRAQDEAVRRHLAVALRSAIEQDPVGYVRQIVPPAGLVDALQHEISLNDRTP